MLTNGWKGDKRMPRINDHNLIEIIKEKAIYKFQRLFPSNKKRGESKPIVINKEMLEKYNLLQSKLVDADFLDWLDKKEKMKNIKPNHISDYGC